MPDVMQWANLVANVAGLAFLAYAMWVLHEREIKRCDKAIADEREHCLRMLRSVRGKARKLHEANIARFEALEKAMDELRTKKDRPN